MEESQTADWYYVGHYGQLGPLTQDQLLDLIDDGVVGGDTFIWKQGMADWQSAQQVAEFKDRLSNSITETSPHVLPPNDGSNIPPQPASIAGGNFVPQRMGHGLPHVAVGISDKNRLTAALLSIIPGFGRFYLGYAAHGVLQFVTSMCGIGLIWSWLDGLYILAGGVKYDGYGRHLND